MLEEKTMHLLKLKGFLAVLLSSALVFAVPALPSSAAVDPCAATITRAGVAATSSDVVVGPISGTVYCLAEFKTVASDYTFVIPSGITSIDYLIVGGGGGGASGGGGGGGVLQDTDYSVSPGSTFDVTVGAGGAGGAGGRSYSSTATSGSSSRFGVISASGGGEGGAENSVGGVDGASGGGSRFDCTSTSCSSGIAGLSIAGQGNNGGYSTYPSYGAGGGGGGAGGAGFNTTRNYIGGNGGSGVISSITGSAVYYAGGGGGGINSNDTKYVGIDSSGNLIYSNVTPLTNGGGQGGLGGGGRGSSWGFTGGTAGLMANATAGAANTGGGGGGTDPEDINAGAGGSGVVVLRWVSSVNLQTVTFSSNFDTHQTTSQIVGKGVEDKLVATAFSRVGYVFAGWNTAADGTGQNYANEALLTTNVDLTLYAKWTPGVTRTVSFNNNTGTGTMANLVAGKPTALTSNAFSKTGFEFAGWNTVANGSGFSYVDADTYQFVTDTTLYAQWQAVVPKFKVTFYGNAADGGATPSQSSATSAPLEINGFTRTGYNFLGWNTNYASASASYRDQQNYAFTSDLSLYAIWVAQTNNNITFDGNLATSGTTPTQTASSSTVLNPNGFVRDGFTFLNWNTAADGTGVAYQSSYAYSFAAGLTLFAQWGLNLEVTYSSNGATSGSVPAAQATYVGSNGITVATNSGNLVKNGYRLAGWNTIFDGTGTPIALGATRTRFTQATTLFAQWVATTYAVIYSGNGNSAGTLPAPQAFTYSTPIAVAENAGNLEKVNHSFDGWNTAPDGTGVTYAAPATNVVLTDDTVLFAKWISIASVNPPSSSGGPYFESTPTPTPSPSPSVTATAPKRATATIAGFGDGQTGLTSSMKAAIKRFLAQHPEFKKVSIIGYTEGRTILKSDARLARSRALAALSFIRKSLKSKLEPLVITGIRQTNESPSLRRIKIILSN